MDYSVLTSPWAIGVVIGLAVIVCVAFDSLF